VLVGSRLNGLAIFWLPLRAGLIVEIFFVEKNPSTHQPFLLPFERLSLPKPLFEHSFLARTICKSITFQMVSFVAQAEAWLVHLNGLFELVWKPAQLFPGW